ncbi:MAG: glycoside hydrolase family 99-like domain-containing protein [Taibaiella sp.]|nr:glycoside hydrolase family 99-like domain-containing protein [Taibaiella sp.]
MNNKIKPLAFYLPQFHPIPENNQWWGPGFTEWTRVANAKPLFKGHHQPIIPADLGFYDLRLAKTRSDQAELAKKYGVHGFIYYHYWFGKGKMLLEQPLEEVIELGEPDFPFCLCWANHSWYNTWEAGKKNQVFMEQTYNGMEDVKKHVAYLAPIFNDKRYIKIDGAPVFMIFAADIKEMEFIIKAYKEEAKNYGIKDIYFIASNVANDSMDYKKVGFDARISGAYGKALGQATAQQNIIEKLKYKLNRAVNPSYPRIVDYVKVSEMMEEEKSSSIPTFPMVLPNWDNTARKEKFGFILKGATPQLFKQNLKKSVAYLQNATGLPEHFLILKSWNEWAEGNILEPDTKYGHQYLQVLKEVIDESNK